MSHEANKAILSEINQAQSWFPAVKTAPVWAKFSDSKNKISSREGSVDVEAGDIICKGPTGDIWVQSIEKFDAKYQSTPEMDDEGFRKCLPIPEKSRVFAAKVDHDFSVQTSHGELTGKPGDYLLKSGDDENEEFPDAWIVGAEIFENTYKRQ